MDENKNPIPSIDSEGKTNIPDVPLKNTDISSLPVNKKPMEEIQKEKIQNSDLEGYTDGEQRSGSHFLLKWFFIFSGLLVGLFYFVLLWGLVSGNVSNPLFETLGIQPLELQQTLLLLTNGIFGILALIFLIGTLIKFFQWLIIGKDAANRREYGIKAGVFFTLFVVSCGIWIGLFWLITNANAENRGLDKSMIQTDPSNVIGLTSPVKIEFDIGTKLFQSIEPNLIRQINWDFDGDGKIDASGPKVTQRFVDKGKNNGRFPVTATVTYFSPSLQEEKSFSMSKEVIISNQAVVAVLKADPIAGEVPLKVKFSAKDSQDPDGSIVLYEWDLDGNGEYEIQGDSAITAEKTFAKVGEFTVRLRTTGSNNDTSIAEQTVIAGSSEENLKADIVAEEGFTGAAPFRVTLDGGQSFTKFGEIVKYEWFVAGDEKAVVGRKIQRTFQKPGEYTVTLTVENDLGEKNRISEIFHVTDGQQKVNLRVKTVPTSDQEGVVRGITPFEVAFSASQSEIKNAVEWRWDFQDDGIIDAYEETVEFIFRNAGNYNVRLTVVDTANKEYITYQKVVVARAGAQAKISANPTSGIVPLMVTFDGSASSSDIGDIVDYIWQFPGEDPINYGAHIAYEFKNVGTFPVKLKILTSTGETNEVSTLISIRSQYLQAHFKATPDVQEPLKVFFDPTSSMGTFTEYSWDFGDGNSSKEFMASHTYQAAGEYNVVLKITGNTGIISTETKRITVVAE
ncbi:PKD domain-containing protein [Candidatus Gracilibacteria bacterium]|nr:PKD domain-containing protein [Candidatus Gracilibacteria bacterium]